MNSKTLLIFLFSVISILSTTQAQNENPKEFTMKQLLEDSTNYLLLIPFNENNKWGWCDTLGNIVIEPQFKKTWGFTYNIVDQHKIYSAFVKTEKGKSYYIPNIGLVAPADYEILSWELGIPFIKNETIRFYHIIKDKNKKIGVFESVRQKMVVSPQYDTSSRYAYREKIILLKENGKATFDYFSASGGSIEDSDIEHVDHLSIRDQSKLSTHCCTTIVKKKDGSVEKIYDGSFEPFQFVDSLKYKSELHLSYAIEMEEEELIPPPGKKTESDNQPDGILATHNYSQYGELPKRYGFTSLSIVRKNNKVGVVNELDEIIVPFEYDKILFRSNSTQAQLFKDGKQGRKLFFTTYPLIEAKFDSIKEYRFLRVKPGWSFALFEIKIGDFIGYVGENGVEYFKLD